MDSRIILVVLLSVVLVTIIAQTVQLNSIKNKITLTGSATMGTPDMSGWTENEKMNYEMHQIIPTRYGAASGGGSPGTAMVGGC